MARKAATLLFILGGVGAAMGLCVGVFIWMIPHELMPKFVDSVLRGRDISLNGMSPEQFVRIFYTFIGFVTLAFSGALLVLAIFVRRAKKGATVAATVFTSLATMNFTLEVLQAANHGLGGDMSAMLSGCVALVLLALFALATLWLVQVLRELPRLQAAQWQYQIQYHQSQQNQANYNAAQSGGAPGHGGYGGYPPAGNPGHTPGAPLSQGYALPPQGNAPTTTGNDEPPRGNG